LTEERGTQKAYSIHAEVVSPNLAIGHAIQQRRFKRRLAVDTYQRGEGRKKLSTSNYRQKREPTERIDDTFILLGHAIDTADPLAAITERTDTFYTMGTLKSRDEKVP
jgi:hypothetical protein